MPPPFGETLLKYEVIDGLAIFEGDIILGSVDDVENPASSKPDAPTEDVGTRSQALSWIGEEYAWPDGEIWFEIDPDVDQQMRNNIADAVDHWEANTNVRFLPGRSESGDYVLFTKGDGCSAAVGRQGGQQLIHLAADCDTGSIVHEIGHAAGLWHEQSRNDRDKYVEILWDNIKEGKEHDFNSHAADGIDLGPYDYDSIMHYPADAFGKEDPANPEEFLQTIETRPPGIPIGVRGNLSTGDIANLGKLYPFYLNHRGGEEWGDGYYATSIAFGDVDGDGRDEVGIARLATDEGDPRFFILDDADKDFADLLRSKSDEPGGGHEWGDGYYATAIAFGDVDGDGRDEVGIARYATDASYARFFILDDAQAGFAQLYEGGGPQDGKDGWGDGYFATSIAFGDVDGDGLAEVGIARYATDANYPRFYILDDAKHGFADLLMSTSGEPGGGHDWGDDYYATSIAFGDVDGDTIDEIGIARYATDEGDPRFIILDDAQAGFIQLHEDGHKWGDGYYATAIAFGNIDDDNRDEVGVARYATGMGYPRYSILDDFKSQFTNLHEGGHEWGDGYYATSIAFADIDGDGREEIGIARVADMNARYWVIDDIEGIPGKRAPWGIISDGGRDWGSGYWATSIAFGDVGGGGNYAVGAARKANENARYWIRVGS